MNTNRGPAADLAALSGTFNKLRETVMNYHFNQDLSEYEDLYKKLHQNPGLSLQEHLASETAATYLRKLDGVDVRTNIGGTGLIGVMKGASKSCTDFEWTGIDIDDDYRLMAKLPSGRSREIGLSLGGWDHCGLKKDGKEPAVMLRADTDALPVEELTGLEYASKKREVDVEDGVEKPVMHACGHDMHVACMLAAAKTLHSLRAHWSGTLIILFQPNEERAGGAKAMIADGLYTRHKCPLPSVVLGQHVMPFPAGTVGTNPGSFASAADSFRVTVYGRGGHASQPHRTIDPVIIAAHIVVRLQTVVSREVDPREAAVVTIGSVQAGQTENIIASEAVLKINVRTVTPETRDRVLAAIRRIVKAECDASGSPKEPIWESTSSFPFTTNDADTTSHVSTAFSNFFGDSFDAEAQPLGGSEDFPILATEVPRKDGGKGVPYCYWTFGGADPVKFEDAKRRGNLMEDVPINHSAYFAPVIRPTLDTGVKALVVGALSFLGK